MISILEGGDSCCPYNRGCQGTSKKPVFSENPKIMLERKKEPMRRCCGGSGVTPLLERVRVGSPTSEDGLLTR